MSNLNKLVSNLFSQVYDMSEHQLDEKKIMEKITQLGQATESVQAKTKELEEEYHTIEKHQDNIESKVMSNIDTIQILRKQTEKAVNLAS